MNGDLWFIVAFVLPFIAAGLVIALKKYNKNVRIAVAAVFIVIYFAYVIWNLYFLLISD